MVFSRAALAAAALLSSAPLVSAVGQAIVQNNCDFPVFLWSVSELPGPMQVLSANGGSYSEAFKTNPDGGGISIKLASVSDIYGASITQFEYTLTNLIYYDISNINGYPFMQWGMSLKPSDSSCRSIICPAGVAQCKAAYNTPDENYATAGCVNTDTNLVAVLCSGDSAPPAAASPTPKPSPKPKANPNPANQAPAAPAAPSTTLVTSVAPPPAASAAISYIQEGSDGAIFGDLPVRKAKRAHQHHFHHHHARS